MLEAIATGNQCVWDYAIAVHNIIETESFSDDYTLVIFQSYRLAKKLRNNEYVRIVIQ